jgi:uncharacterized protein YndB with AHSA1/START domain
LKWVRRIVAVVVGLPALAVVALLVAGQRPGAGRNTERVAIAKPPNEVFRHLEEEDLLKKWTRLAELKRLTEGGLRRGTRWRMAAEARGQRTQVEGEVTAVETGRYLAVLLKSLPGAPIGFTQAVEYRLEGRDGGTRLTMTADTQYEGFLPRLLEPLITRAAQTQMEQNLERLRQQVETQSAAPPGPQERRSPRE